MNNENAAEYKISPKNAADYVTCRYYAQCNPAVGLKMTLRHQLPPCHATREQIADALADAGYAVHVYRTHVAADLMLTGSAGGPHGSRSGGRRVDRIEVVGLLPVQF